MMSLLYLLIIVIIDIANCDSDSGRIINKLQTEIKALKEFRQETGSSLIDLQTQLNTLHSLYEELNEIQIDLESSVDRLHSDFESAVTSLEASDAAETAARTTDDDKLASLIITGIHRLTKTLYAEKRARKTSDGILAARIDASAADISAEEAARIEADDILETAISDETTARMDADDTLRGSIDDLVEDISTEQAARIASDDTLTTAISDEATTRTAADDALNGAIADEATARIAADSSLQDQINAISGGGGGGGRDPFLGVNYIIALQGVFPSSSRRLLQSGGGPFIGEIILWAPPILPRGWLFCDGQLLQISSNSALFSLLGTAYGGDGRTTFGLPDLRGRVSVGEGSGPGLDSIALGQTGGSV